MSQVPNTFKVPVAIKDHSEMDLSCNVVMSHDFGVSNPIYNRFLVPGDKFTIRPEFFTYLAPLPCPTFGDISLITRSFFVPFRVLMDNWKEFISANYKVHMSGADTTLSPTELKFTTVSDFTLAFYTSRLDSAHRLINPNGTRADICIVSLTKDDDSIDYSNTNYELTYYGRQVLSFLRGLGYNFPFVMVGDNVTYDDVKDNETHLSLFRKGTTKLSLLPIIAFWRAYIDWIIPSRFIHNHASLLRALDEFKQSYPVSGSGLFDDDYWGLETLSSPIHANYAFLRPLLQMPTSYLSDDFFTSAYTTAFGTENASALNGSVVPQPVDNSNNMASAYVSLDDGGAELNATDPVINMFSLRSLGALQDMVYRGKVAGTKIQDYLKVTYGIEPGSSALDISTYLGSHTDKIKIGSVSSNADTFVESSGNGAYLGQFAGRGLGGSENIGTYSYEAKEHGLLFITCELVAKSSYWQGLRPECCMLSRYDFFQPEFDAMGTEPIPQKLLNFSQGLNIDDDNFIPDNNTINPEQPFGYQSQYASLKVGFDSLLGDFRVGGLNEGMDSWYLARFMEAENKYINETFSRMVQDNTSKEYDHIFQLADNSADHFYTHWRLDVKAVRPMKPLSETLEFEDNSGRKVETHFNGAVNS